jgi:Rieske 2Fe-2S family protein
MIYPNITIDLYPDQVITWRIDPDGPLRARDESLGYRHPEAGVRTRLAQRVNNRLNTIVGHEDADLVENVQAGLETRGLELGPLSHREAAIAWFADRVRADLDGAA